LDEWEVLTALEDFRKSGVFYKSEIFLSLVFFQVFEIPMKFIGHRVVAISSPWITTKDTPNSEIKPFDGSVLLECLDGIS
jgi:hypothetical protein